MTPQHPLLGIGDRDLLRRRYRQSSGRLRRMHDHLIWIARNPEWIETHGMERLHLVNEGLVRPMARPDERCYAFLAYLLTGDRAFAESAKQSLWRFCDSVLPREDSEWCQMHTWCDAFPSARFGFFYDWLKADGLFTPEEDARFRDAFLYYCRMHPYERLQARLIETTPGNNQNGAMAFACATAGYLFGCRYGNDPQAVRLLEFSLPYLVKFVTCFPRGGYSGEGSAYMAGVNALLIVLGLEVIRAATGQDYFETRAASHLASPRETLESVATQCGRSGLLHPWDNYGYGLASHGFVGAYLAHRSGDAARLRFLESIGATHRVSHIGWGFDNRLWMLLYWPAEAECAPSHDLSLNEVHPSLKATVEGPRRRYHCMQMWDPSDWPPSRHQFNPNSIVTEFDGCPLLVDGSPWEAGPERFNRPEFKWQRRDTGTEGNFGIGTLAAHNVIVVDGEESYATRPGTAGTFLRSAFLGTAGYVAADATACYAPRYDVTRVTRESLLLDDDLLLVRDRLTARSRHAYTWLAHLRPGAVSTEPGLIRLETPESTVMDLAIAEGAGAFARREGNCWEASYPFAGHDATALTALAVHSRLRVLQDMSSGWDFVRADSEEAAMKAGQSPSRGLAADIAGGPWFVTTDEDRPGFGVYRRTIALSPLPAGRCILRLPPLMLDLTLGINGACRKLKLNVESPDLLPRFLDVTDDLRAGPNAFVLISRSSLDVSLSGHVVLYEQMPAPAASRLAKAGEGTYRLSGPGGVDRIVWRDEPMPFDFDGIAGRAACVVSRADGTLVALRATEVRSGRFRFSADFPADFSMTADSLTLADMGETNRIRASNGEISVEIDVNLVASVRWARGTESFRLRLVLPAEAPRLIFVDNRLREVSPGPGNAVEIACEPLAADRQAETTGSAGNLSRIAGLPMEERASFSGVLSDAIQSADWRVQLEALEAARGLTDPAVVRAARALLEREVGEHETLPKRRDGDRNWYRVKAAAARVLGDARVAAAVPLLAKILLGDDFYPARLACVDALAAIGTPDALAALKAVPEDDEHNVSVKSRLVLRAKGVPLS